MSDELEPMGIMATQALRNLKKQLMEVYASLTSAHRYSNLAAQYTAPDFSEQIRTEMERVDNLISRVTEVTPETEKHDGVRRMMRGELTLNEKERIREMRS